MGAIIESDSVLGRDQSGGGPCAMRRSLPQMILALPPAARRCISAVCSDPCVDVTASSMFDHCVIESPEDEFRS